MLKIPPEQLPEDTLRAIVEAYVLREGTDYGDGEYSLDDKIDQVIDQIARDLIVITFDAVTETCNLLTQQAWQALCAEQQEHR